MCRRSRLLSLCLALFAGALVPCLGPRPALAQTAEARAQSQKKAREGQRLADSGQHEQALGLFKEAYAITQEPGYLYNIGIEYQALGRDVDAYSAFERFLRDVQKIPPEFIADANQQQRELRKRIGELEIRCTQEGARITIDDREPLRTPLDELIRVSTGTHRVSVQKEGFEPFQRMVSVTGGNRLRVEALMRPVPVKGGGSTLAASAVPSLGGAPENPVSPSLRDAPDAPLAPAASSEEQRPPFYLALAAGVGLWTAGVPRNPQPSGTFSLSAGYRVAEIAPRVEVRVGAKAGFTFVSEQSVGTDLFFSALANPMLTADLIPNRLLAFAEVGAGLLVISGVAPGSVLLRGGQDLNVTGALGTFELRPGVGIGYALHPSLAVFLEPALAWSPKPDPLFAEKSIVRVEIVAGAMYHM